MTPRTVAEVANLKSRIRERDGYVCTSCGMTNAEHVAEFGCSLEVHRTEPGEYQEAASVTLCKRCHSQEPKCANGWPIKRTAKVEIRAEPEWVAWVKEGADRKGLSVSAFARMVVTERLEHDGTPKPASKKPRHRD